MAHLAPPARRSNKLIAAAVLVAAAIVTAVVALTQMGSDGSSNANGDRSPVAAPVTPSRATSTPAATSPAATSPTISPTATPTSTPTTRASTSAVARNSGVAKQSSKPRKALTYVVKRGDNLTVIADWFKLHGYGDLYERNRDVIGSDPDLIRPGQKITVSSDGMTTSR